MIRNDNKYPINQSPLYKIGSRTRLSEILQFDILSFDQIITDKNYRVFPNKKGRPIQYPLNELRSIHDRIQGYLKRIQVPDYLHSQKGRSYITNATRHSPEHPLLKTDITKFYPNTSFSAVFAMFEKIFKCAPDVSWTLARLCCVHGKHLPTGSPISGSIAFFAHQPMFDAIDALAKSQGCVFTLFVDDLGVSGFSASRSLLFAIRGIIRSHGLDTADKKSKTHGMGRPRKITGVMMTRNGPMVPNKRLQKIHVLKKQILGISSDTKREKMEKSLRGSLQEASQIESANKLFVAAAALSSQE